MKKRVLSFLLVVLAFSFSVVALTGCLSDEEKKVVGKYELTDISVNGFPNITTSTYEYFTIEFKDNKKCQIKSKAGTTVYDAEASWKINGDGEIEVITRSGFATATEIYTYSDDIITGTNESVVDGRTITMTVNFERIVSE